MPPKSKSERRKANDEKLARLQLVLEELERGNEQFKKDKSLKKDKSKKIMLDIGSEILKKKRLKQDKSKEEKDKSKVATNLKEEMIKKKKEKAAKKRVSGDWRRSVYEHVDNVMRDWRLERFEKEEKEKENKKISQMRDEILKRKRRTEEEKLKEKRLLKQKEKEREKKKWRKKKQYKEIKKYFYEDKLSFEKSVVKTSREWEMWGGFEWTDAELLDLKPNFEAKKITERRRIDTEKRLEALNKSLRERISQEEYKKNEKLQKLGWDNPEIREEYRLYKLFAEGYIPYLWRQSVRRATGVDYQHIPYRGMDLGKDGLNLPIATGIHRAWIRFIENLDDKENQEFTARMPLEKYSVLGMGKYYPRKYPLKEDFDEFVKPFDKQIKLTEQKIEKKLKGRKIVDEYTDEEFDSDVSEDIEDMEDSDSEFEIDDLSFIF